MFCFIAVLLLAGSDAGATPRTSQEGQQRPGESHLASSLLFAMCTEQSLWLTNSSVLGTRSRVRKEE